MVQLRSKSGQNKGGVLKVLIYKLYINNIIYKRYINDI